MKATSEKIEKQEKKKTDITYPILMEHISSKKVVLFTRLHTGTIVQPGNLKDDQSSLGVHYKDNWIDCTDEATWVPYTGAIILQND